MRNLLSAGFSRLWRSRIFWLCCAAVLVISVVSMFNGCRMAEAYDDQSPLEDYYFNTLPVISFVCAVFSGLFFGTEYSDGTLCNKLIVGHTRRDVYLSGYILCFAAVLIMTALLFLGGLCGIPKLGVWQMGAGALAVYFLLSALMAASIAAISAFIALLSHSKAVTAVISITVMLGLLIFASFMYNSLCEPETYSGMMMTVNGLEAMDPEPNPAYVGGAMRGVYEFLVDLLPQGQAILMADTELAHPLRAGICSAALVLVVNLAGLILFGKKDLK